TSGYTLPETLFPSGLLGGPLGPEVWVMAGALLLAAGLVLRVRSRRWIRVAGIAALICFGFVRRGCLCPMGPVQSVSAALAGVPDAGLTLVAFLLFGLPLLAALFFGRVYCASVCPHGALQD